MCLAEPMQLVDVRAHRATAVGRHGRRTIDIALVAPALPGEWVLVFLDAARRRIGADAAREVNAMLDLVAAAMAGEPAPAADAPGFELPSAQSAGALDRLVGRSAAAPGSDPTGPDPT